MASLAGHAELGVIGRGLGEAVAQEAADGEAVSTAAGNAVLAAEVL